MVACLARVPFQVGQRASDASASMHMRTVVGQPDSGWVILVRVQEAQAKQSKATWLCLPDKGSSA